MTDQVKGTEEFFLKIVKHAILGLMGLALIAIPLLLIYGASNFLSQPKEPEPAKKAPVKEVTMDGLAQYLLELQKKQEEAEKFDPSKKKASEQDQPPAIYLIEAVNIFGCLQKFAVAAEIELPVDRDSSREALEYRGRLESDASKAGRGAPYVASLNNFICKVLADPAIVAIRKDKKFKGVFGAANAYHLAAWDRIVSERNQFEASEQARVQGERAAEALRIAGDRARAITAITGAGAAFAVFMLLAIYLILAKIETNMRDINDSLRARPS